MKPLKPKLDLFGSICGVAGITLCLLAGLLRIFFGAGNPTDIIIAPRSMLAGGTAIMVFGCWLKLSARSS